MITLLYGDNDFEVEREMHRRIASFDDTAERIEGDTLELHDLPDLLLGASLFSDHRLIIIKRLSENRAVWTELAEYTERMSEKTHLVLVETAVDKRTKIYKMLQKHAEIKEYKPWTERESVLGERWVADETKRLGVSIEPEAVRMLVRRSLIASERGAVIDQWRLLSNLEKLASLELVTSADVEKYVEESPIESVFGLLETALRGDYARIREMVGRLEPIEDPFKLFGLLSGQVFWLGVLASTSKVSAEAAKDFGVHPFVLSKLAPYAKALGQTGAGRVSTVFAEADAAMKTSGGEPWILIERALTKTAGIVPATAKRSAV